VSLQAEEVQEGQQEAHAAGDEGIAGEARAEDVQEMTEPSEITEPTAGEAIYEGRREEL
jgi:hypothetical protein